jgi:hypothetical protein
MMTCNAGYYISEENFDYYAQGILLYKCARNNEIDCTTMVEYTPQYQTYIA